MFMPHFVQQLKFLQKYSRILGLTGNFYESLKTHPFRTRAIF